MGSNSHYDGPLKVGRPKARSWNPWPACLVGFFAVAILSCAGFVAFCSLHPSELVAPNYYEQEMRYQGQMDRIQNASALEAEALVTYDPAAHTITVTLPAPTEDAQPTGTIRLYRPSAAGLDRQFDLALERSGVQRIDARSLAPGLWKVRVSWTAAKKQYYLDRPIIVPGRPA